VQIGSLRQWSLRLSRMNLEFRAALRRAPLVEVVLLTDDDWAAAALQPRWRGHHRVGNWQGSEWRVGRHSIASRLNLLILPMARHRRVDFQTRPSLHHEFLAPTLRPV